MRRLGPRSISGAIVLSVTALLALSGFLMIRQSHAGVTTIDLLAIDMDNAGNSIGTATDTDADTTPDTETTTLGSIDQATDKCASIATNGSITIDIVLHGYPPSAPLVAYDITLNYDPTLVRVGG
ncbi:MAG: hypothetical protein GTN71_04885, partial [Anaerolineae bacterium]|nr:hypothetical protein [Gemmatimonadales bacterium]NIO68388.1 hypothetical protein [Anaerolineae bacterium]